MLSQIRPSPEGLLTVTARDFGMLGMGVILHALVSAKSIFANWANVTRLRFGLELGLGFGFGLGFGGFLLRTTCRRIHFAFLVVRPIGKEMEIEIQITNSEAKFDFFTKKILKSISFLF